MKKKTDRGGGHPELRTGRSREIRMDRDTMSRRQRQKEKAMEGQVERPRQRIRKRDQGMQRCENENSELHRRRKTGETTR